MYKAVSRRTNNDDVDVALSLHAFCYPLRVSRRNFTTSVTTTMVAR